MATKSCLKDFLLMKKTFELYHPDSSIVVGTDRYCHDYINGNFKNVRSHFYEEIEDGDHVSSDSCKKQSFKKVISKKFDIALSQDISPDNPILWCDVDHIFVNKIDDEVLQGGKFYDAALTPHYSDGFANEAEVGFFNCGFALIFNKSFLKVWKKLYDHHEELNLYYEQKPLEAVIRSFNTLNLPINYNFGWWKFMPKAFGGNVSKLRSGPDIVWENKSIKSFHFHFFKNDSHSYDKTRIKKVLIQLFDARAKNRKEDHVTMHEIKRLSNENF